MDQQAEKDRKSNRTRQKNKRGESKVESNDSPEIPDRGETSDIPGLPSGGNLGNMNAYSGIEYSISDTQETS